MLLGAQQLDPAGDLLTRARRRWSGRGPGKFVAGARRQRARARIAGPRLFQGTRQREVDLAEARGLGITRLPLLRRLLEDWDRSIAQSFAEQAQPQRGQRRADEDSIRIR